MDIRCCWKEGGVGLWRNEERLGLSERGVGWRWREGLSRPIKQVNSL